MPAKLDTLLLAFLHGHLPVWKRQYVRAKLLADKSARVRLAQLQYTTALIAGTFGAAEPAGFQANLAVRLRRMAMVDLAILAIIGLAVAGAAMASWGRYYSTTISCDHKAATYYPDARKIPTVPKGLDCPTPPVIPLR